MKKMVYIVTNEETHAVYGACSSYRKAMLIVWSVAEGCTIESCKPEFVGLRLNCRYPDGDPLTLYIEEVQLDDPVMVGYDPIDESLL